MLKTILIILLTLPAFSAQKTNTHVCAYWLSRLGDIEVWEKILFEMRKNLGGAGPEDIDDLRSKIKLLQETISLENKE